MADPAERLSLPYAEYLAREANSDVKHEYVNGEVYAMAGGTIEHGALIFQVGGLIRAALANGPCIGFSSDVRVRISAFNRSYYPDLSVVCGKVERASDDSQAIVNPTVIVEVLSESTELYDRGEKSWHYRTLPSLREYVLVSQDKKRVEVFERGANGTWVLREAGPNEGIRVASISLDLSVNEIYQGQIYDA